MQGCKEQGDIDTKQKVYGCNCRCSVVDGVTVMRVDGVASILYITYEKKLFERTEGF